MPPEQGSALHLEDFSLVGVMNQEKNSSRSSWTIDYITYPCQHLNNHMGDV